MRYLLFALLTACTGPALDTPNGLPPGSTCTDSSQCAGHPLSTTEHGQCGPLDDPTTGNHCVQSWTDDDGSACINFGAGEQCYD